MKKYFILVVILLLAGCSMKEAKVSISCDGIKSELVVQKGDKISCDINNKIYEFKVEKVEDNSISITTENEFINKEKSYEVKNGNELVLNIDDKQNIIFNKE